MSSSGWDGGVLDFWDCDLFDLPHVWSRNLGLIMLPVR